MAENNPLRKYFRQPAIHARLPSNGKFYPDGTIDMPPTGEIPIYPMTAVDEITSRTPDALFNGSAVMEIIGSCVPNIKDPWSIPNLDLNTLLVAIRLASYGHEMEIVSVCPKCGHTHDITVDLRHVLDQMKTPNYDETVVAGDLTFYFNPLTYREINANGKIQFEDQKIVQMINNTEMSEEEKMSNLGDAFRKITELTITSIAQSVAAVKSTDVMVTEKEYLVDFLHNCPKEVFEQVRDHIMELREATDITPVKMKCDECENEYEQPFTLDITNFFGNAS
jgi:hypothetical protein